MSEKPVKLVVCINSTRMYCCSCIIFSNYHMIFSEYKGFEKDFSEFRLVLNTWGISYSSLAQNWVLGNLGWLCIKSRLTDPGWQATFGTNCKVQHFLRWDRGHTVGGTIGRGRGWTKGTGHPRGTTSTVFLLLTFHLIFSLSQKCQGSQHYFHEIQQIFKSSWKNFAPK